MMKLNKQGELMLSLLLSSGVDVTKTSYEEREKLKKCAWDLYYFSETIEEKCIALTMVALSEYYRSVAASGSKHPEFHIYFQHWLWAQKNNSFNVDDLYFPIVMKRLIKEIGLPNQPRIPKGKSYWT